ncbi:MAG TPA: LOG family protein [Acidimicrobiales bacterium]
MPERTRRRRTGRPDIDRSIEELLDAAGAKSNRDQLFEILATTIRMASNGADRLDLKITNAAVKEMAEAFAVFAPYRSIPKLTMFGSARTRTDDPLYAQARALAANLARAGWMLVTGAGPGIMAAGLEGAGPDKAFGINIRLPFEDAPNAFISGDPKLVEMKYFFTRKLMLLKESDGYAVLPGGFGTMDEAFELLTLLQTGKAEPSPLVFVDVPGGTYWQAWERFVTDELSARGLISPDDAALYRITDDVACAAAEVLDFYRHYHSLRVVGDVTVIRLNTAPSDDRLAELNRDFADICVRGGIDRTEALPQERAGRDHVDLPRIVLHFDRAHYGRLRQLIDALNKP